MQSELINKMQQAVVQHASRPAIWVNGVSYTYQHFFARVYGLANKLMALSTENDCCAILCDKNIHTYQAILAALFAGKCYVPMMSNSPLLRNVDILLESKAKTICIDSQNVDLIVSLLEKIPPACVIIFDPSMLESVQERVSCHQYVLHCDKADATLSSSSLPQHDDNAYLLFTSGSTGKPKGICVSHGNLLAYIDAFLSHYSPDYTDKLTQFCELTFDISAHEMFISWVTGACLYVIPGSYMLGVADFIRQHKISYFLTVPSTVGLLKQLDGLGENSFPNLKYSFFCGEVFIHAQAVQWHLAAPNSKIVNLYGPTEATVAVSHFQWQPDWGGTGYVGVPIGWPMRALRMRLVDKHGEPVVDGVVGELCLSGPQVVAGYFNNSAKTRAAFCRFAWDESGALWYKTGDLARFDADVGFQCLGRLDDQWQIGGYRVEKSEIEYHLKQIIGHNNIAVVAIRNEQNTITHLAAFVVGELDVSYVKRMSRKRLPDYMIPKKIISLDALPLNQNGKINYPMLIDLAKFSIKEGVI